MTQATEATAAKPSVHFLSSSVWAVGWYRCHVPGMELQRRGYDVALHHNPQTLHGEQPDILVGQSIGEHFALSTIGRFQDAGCRVIADVDDDLWALHPENPAYGYWTGRDTLEVLSTMVRMADKVSVSTPELADQVRRFNSKVTVLPNMLPAEHWPKERRHVRETGPLVVGWAGSASHKQDVRMIEDVLIQILDRYENVEVHIAGGEPDWIRNRHPRIRLVPPVRIEQYASLLQGFDIALAPLADTRFNEGKSDLKALEYGMVGLPVIASKSPSYVRSLRHGESALLVRSQKDWLQSLRNLIEDAQLRDRLGAEIRAWAETRTIEANGHRWEKAYGLTK